MRIYELPGRELVYRCEVRRLRSSVDQRTELSTTAQVSPRSLRVDDPMGFL
jgi:hypothetical protein